MNRLSTHLSNDRGVTMVGTMVVLGLLGLFAFVIAELATTERKTTFNDFVRAGSFFSADSGGESAIDFLAEVNKPPRFTDFNASLIKSAPTTTVHETQRYTYDIAFDSFDRPFGWGQQFKGIVYGVDATGEAASDGEATVGVVVTRSFKVGY